LIDIFVTIGSAGDTKQANYIPDPAAADVTEIQSSPEHNANGGSTPAKKKESSKSRIRRTINEKHLDRIWSAYVQNHMQYLSREQVQATARELDRSEDSIQYHLRKMIAAHRNVPVEDALNDAFSNSEDARIWSSYTRNVDSAHFNEGKIVASLSHELHRTAEDVHNRLQWLKAQQSQQLHRGASDHSFDSDEHHEVKKSKHRCQSSNSSKSHTEEPREHRRHKHYTSQENVKIEKAHQQDNLSPSEIGQALGRTTKAIEHRLREAKHSGAGTTATPRASLAERYIQPRTEGDDDDSSDESTFEVVDRSTSNTHGAHRHTRAAASTSTAASSATSAAAPQWFEDGRFSDAPRRRSRDTTDEQGGVEEPSDRKRRKRAADFMQDAFQCDTFDAGIDSYSDMDSD